MKKFTVCVPYSGYSRGDDVYEVEANSPEEAEQIVKDYGGEFLYRDITRDDTEKQREDCYCVGEING